jgi:hypothetical protein
MNVHKSMNVRDGEFGKTTTAQNCSLAGDRRHCQSARNRCLIDLVSRNLSAPMAWLPANYDSVEVMQAIIKKSMNQLTVSVTG